MKSTFNISGLGFVPVVGRETVSEIQSVVGPSSPGERLFEITRKMLYQSYN